MKLHYSKKKGHLLAELIAEETELMQKNYKNPKPKYAKRIAEIRQQCKEILDNRQKKSK